MVRFCTGKGHTFIHDDMGCPLCWLEERKQLQAENKKLKEEKTSVVKHPTDLKGKPNSMCVYCFSCGTTVRTQKYCHGCGRKLDWKLNSFDSRLA